jgi:uncharacterized protein YabN with tetrapyrrole methylase and pyrophosphatase domain
MPPRKTRKTIKRSKRPARSSKSTPGSAFERLVAVMSRLRSPNGCPWDREQTHSTLRTYLIEEAYEVLDALDSGDDAKFAEELGDLLLQVLFHAQIASEENRFTISEVIREIHEKMIRRHPHVFGTARAKTAADVLHNWEIIKRQERESKRKVAPASSRQSLAGLQTGDGVVADLQIGSDRGVEESLFDGSAQQPPRGSNAQAEPAPRSLSEGGSDSFTSSPSPTSILDGVPRTLPALLEAFQLTRKAARIGFDWDHVDGIFDKLNEETTELRQELQKHEVQERQLTNHASIESELGDLLFVLVNLARFLHIDPEIALKKTNSKFTRRFHSMERLALEQGTTLAQVPRAHLEPLWEQAKLLERQ